MSVDVYLAHLLDDVADVEVEQEDEGLHSVCPRFGKGG